MRLSNTANTMQRQCRVRQLSVRAVAAPPRPPAQTLQPRVTLPTPLVKPATSVLELRTQLSSAEKGKLVVVEVQSESYRAVSRQPEVELHWRDDIKRRQKTQKTASLKFEAAVHRAAQQCPHISFVQVKVPDQGYNRQQLISALQLAALPSIQFYKDQELLWEQQGQPGLERALGAGILFYTGSGAEGVAADSAVRQLTSTQAVNDFLQCTSSEPQGSSAQPNPAPVKVLFVCESTSPKSILVYPAMVGLAANFPAQRIQFGRCVLDECAGDVTALIKQLQVVSAPTFLLYQGGREVQRYVGSTASDLLGHVLGVLETLPPETTVVAEVPETVESEAGTEAEQPAVTTSAAAEVQTLAHDTAIEEVAASTPAVAPATEAEPVVSSSHMDSSGSTRMPQWLRVLLPTPQLQASGTVALMVVCWALLYYLYSQ